MKNFKPASWFFVVSILGLLIARASASGLDGSWKIELARPGGIVLRTYLVLHQQGTNLNGKVIINNSVDLPLRQTHMEGPIGVFNIDWGAAYRVRPDGDKLDVTILYGGSSREEAKATRATDDEIQPPKRLPLPGLNPISYNGLAKTPPMGWNSWNHFAGSIDDKTVREIADAMATNGMAAAGYVYVNIDDTWEGGRDPQGNIIPNNKFPDMKALADYVHARGLKLGIYSSPGPVTCGGYEGSYGHEEQDAGTFATWGIDYLKYDWCSAARVYTEDEMRAAYQKMGAALAGCGRPIVYSLCEYGRDLVWRWGADAGANLWRTTDDIKDNWTSMSGIGFKENWLAPYAGPGHWNDPDMLEVGNGGMSSTEYKTHFSLWCMLAAPLIAGNDLRNMSNDTLQILTNREIIAVDQDVLGEPGQRVMKLGDVEIWSKPLQDHGRALGVFNRSETNTNVKISWAQFGLAAKPALLHDLWEHQDLTPAAEGWEAQVPAHGVAMLIAK
jgi:alpha-galactosidase